MLDTQEECIALLEQLRWGGQPRCPYCNSTRSVPLKRELRHHCNNCFTSYSVTVGTLFHRTHVELPKWFQAMKAVRSKEKRVSVRQLASEIGVSKSTASYIMFRIHKADTEESELLTQLYKVIDEPDR